MTIKDILVLEEGQTFDRKSIKIKPKDLANTVVAMANADGGDIVIGLTDSKREIEGVDYETEKTNDLLRVPFDFCIPTVQVRVERVPCKDKDGRNNHLLVMHIAPSDRVHANQSDEVFLRVGDRSKKLTFEERYTLMSDKGEIKYEESWVRGATMKDIDMSLVKDYVGRLRYGKSPLDFLKENNGYTVEREGELYPSAASILLFGKKPQDFFRRAYVRFIRYEGTEEKVGREMNVVKDVIFEGTIRDQIDKAVSFLNTQIKEHSYLGEDGLFVTDEEYPEFVRKEIIVNACCHRDYSISGTDIQVKMFDNRLVVESPGNLPGLVRPDNIRHTHFSRNPIVARYLKTYGYVKEFGEGVDRMCSEMEALGLQPIQYRRVGFMVQAVAWNQTNESIDIGGESVKINPKSVNIDGESVNIDGESVNIDAKNARRLPKGGPVGQKLEKESISKLFRRAGYREPTIKKIQLLFETIDANEVFGSRLIMQILNCSDSLARKILAKLRDEGLVEPVTGAGKGKYIFKSQDADV